MLTLLGAKGTANQIDNLTVADPATTAKLHLYAVTSDGGKTEEFDGENLLNNRILHKMEDVSYQIELVDLTELEMPISSPRPLSPRSDS